MATRDISELSFSDSTESGYVLCQETPHPSQQSREIVFTSSPISPSSPNLKRKSLNEMVVSAVDDALTKRLKVDLPGYDEFILTKERDQAILRLQQSEQEHEARIQALEHRITELQNQVWDLQATIAAKDLKHQNLKEGCRTNVADFTRNLEKLF